MRRSIIVLLGLVMGTLVVLAPAADAWEAEHEATSGCTDEQATIAVTFRNLETRDHARFRMDVTATDDQSGVSVDLGTINPVGGEASAVIETGLAVLDPSQVSFTVAWPATPDIEIRVSPYDAAGPCTDDITELCFARPDGSWVLRQVPTSLVDMHLANGAVVPKPNGECPEPGDDGMTRLCVVVDGAFELQDVPDDQVDEYLAGTAEYPVNGACRTPETFTICHFAEDGNSVSAILVNEFDLPDHLLHGDYNADENGNCVPPIPDVEICHVNDDGTVELVVIPGDLEAEHLAHGDFPPDANDTCEDVYGICVVDFDALTVELAYVRLPELTPLLTAGSFLPDTVTGCDGNVQLCHRGDDGSVTLITVPTVLVPSHLAHDDTPINQQGTCGRLAEICHVDNGSVTKIEVPFGELADHFAHGDYLPLTTGECVDPETRMALCLTEDGGTTYHLVYIAQEEVDDYLNSGDAYIPQGGPPFVCDGTQQPVAPLVGPEQPFIPKDASLERTPVVNDGAPIVVPVVGRALGDEFLQGLVTPIDDPAAFHPLLGADGGTSLARIARLGAMVRLALEPLRVVD